MINDINIIDILKQNKEHILEELNTDGVSTGNNPTKLRATWIEDLTIDDIDYRIHIVIKVGKSPYNNQYYCYFDITAQELHNNYWVRNEDLHINSRFDGFYKENDAFDYMCTFINQLLKE